MRKVEGGMRNAKRNEIFRWTMAIGSNLWERLSAAIFVISMLNHRG